MPTLGIGNRPAGFTLLEILAVLILLGFAVVLAFPSLTQRDERLALTNMAKLLGDDMKLLQDEAVSECTAMEMTIDSNGYEYVVNDRKIERIFREYEFQLIPAPDAKEPESGDDSKQETEAISRSIKIDAQGRVEPAQISWRSSHFHGVINITAEAKVEWDYANK